MADDVCHWSDCRSGRCTSDVMSSPKWNGGKSTSRLDLLLVVQTKVSRANMAAEALCDCVKLQF